MENGNEPATKQDVVGLKQDIAMIRSEMQHTYDALIERMTDNQTGLLKAFYSFAESNQTRLTETERESAALKERIGILERRLTDVERKVNFPNSPTQ